jgi:hypothetical protein
MTSCNQTTEIINNFTIPHLESNSAATPQKFFELNKTESLPIIRSFQFQFLSGIVKSDSPDHIKTIAAKTFSQPFIPNF